MSEEVLPGLPLASDPDAESTDRALPAFVARPAGAPAYHGFPVLEDVEVDGFTLGLISDSLSTQSSWGDAFVVAPDGRRAGLVWEAGQDRRFESLVPADADRWGVFSVATDHTPISNADARLFLAELVPRLRVEWERSLKA